MPHGSSQSSELRTEAIKLAGMGDKELDEIIDLERKVAIANEFFRMAEECQIDCSGPRSVVERVTTTSAAIKRTFLADLIRDRQVTTN